MGQRIILGCGIFSMLCALVVVVVGVIVANGMRQEVPATSQTDDLVQEEARYEPPQPVQSYAPSEADDAQAESRRALEEDLAAQQEFQAGMDAARERQKQQAARSMARIGDTVTVGGVQWRVTRAWRTQVLKQREFGQFGETKQGNFVVVDFLFANASDEPVTLDSISLALLDSRGRKSQPDTDTFGYIPYELNPFFEQVNPGVTEQGRVIFTVAPDASGFVLQVGDTDMFTDTNGYIDLGF